MSFLFGRKSPYKTQTLNTFTPEQRQLFSQLFGHVGPQSYLSRLAGGDQSMFEEMEAPALQQFSGQLGGLASRFSNMGMGARRSSGFQNTATQAVSDFAQQLQQQRQGLQRQALGDLFSMSQMLMGQRPQEQFLTPRPPSFLQSILGGAGNLGASLAGTGGNMWLFNKMFGNPWQQQQRGM